MRLRNIRGTIRFIFVLLLVMSQLFLSQPLVSAVIGDRAQVSPGKIPRPNLPYDKEDNHYLGSSSFRVKLEYPRSFILQETVGDLQFSVNLTGSRRRIDIYIPPEFKVNTGSNYVWTNITNNYASIGITKAGSFDSVAPNWYKVSITSGAIELGIYSIRVFNVTAPSIVGLYFFKVFTDDTSIGAKYFPSVVVSADPNPAYVSGTIRYGGRLVDYSYGAPINLNADEGGRVCAVGITAEGRIVIGQAYFNASANYTLYGLAPGKYTLNATAAGYAPGELPYPILFKAGQSMEGVDIFLEHSPVTTIVALSRWVKQPAQWGALRNGTDIASKNKTITLEVFDLWNTTIRLLNSTTDNKTTFHTFVYRGERDLDGHIPQDNANYTGGIGPGRYYFRVWVNGYVQPSAANEWVWRNECAVVFSRNEQNRRIEILLEKMGSLRVTVHFTNSTQTFGEATTGQSGTLIVEAYNIIEEMRARNSTFVPAGSRTASVELTGLFNSSRDYGLPPGEYIIFARLAPPRLFDFYHPYYVSVGEVYLPSAYRYGPTGHRVTIGDGRNEISFYVLLQGGLNLTIYPITPQKPFNITTWKYPKSAISVEIRDRLGVEVYGSFRLSQQNKILPDGREVLVNNTASVIGLDDGTYSIYIFTYGYIQERVVFFSVRRGEIADISAYVVTGGEIKITLVFQKQKILYPIDTYKNYWSSSSRKVPVRFEIYDSEAQFVGANATYIPIPDENRPTVFSDVTAGFKTYRGNAATTWVNYYDTTDGTRQRDYGMGPGWYTLKVYVPGYRQKSDPTIEVKRGGETSVVILLERMAHLYGKVHTFNTYLANYTRISWVSVDVIGEEMTLWTCTLDGAYELWMVPGSYLVAFSLPAYRTEALRLQIPDGSDVHMDLQLLPFGTELQSYVSSFSPSSLTDTFETGLRHPISKYLAKISAA